MINNIKDLFIYLFLESFIDDDSMFDDDVFEEEQSVMTSLSKTTSQS
jgi:hypothetical protein